MSAMKIRVPKDIWNFYDPKAHIIERIGPNPTRILTPAKKNQIIKASTKPQHRSPQQPSHCKVKLWRFHYGGPKRKTKGKVRNEVAYEQPCLKPTCATCWKWHAHLLREDRIRGKANGDEQQGRRPYEKYVSLPGDKDGMFLPTFLHTSTLSTNTITARTKWSAEPGPRRRYVARLAFPSHEGKTKFKVLLMETQR